MFSQGSANAGRALLLPPGARARAPLWHCANALRSAAVADAMARSRSSQPIANACEPLLSAGVTRFAAAGSHPRCGCGVESRTPSHSHHVAVGMSQLPVRRDAPLSERRAQHCPVESSQLRDRMATPSCANLLDEAVLETVESELHIAATVSCQIDDSVHDLVLSTGWAIYHARKSTR